MWGENNVYRVRETYLFGLLTEHWLWQCRVGGFDFAPDSAADDVLGDGDVLALAVSMTMLLAMSMTLAMTLAMTVTMLVSMALTPAMA